MNSSPNKLLNCTDEIANTSVHLVAEHKIWKHIKRIYISKRGIKKQTQTYTTDTIEYGYDFNESNLNFKRI